MEHSNPILMGNNSPQKFITIGEVMLRLTPPNYEKIRMTSTFEASYGGSEANIALALANLGVDSTFFSVVPNNSLGKSAVRWLRCNDVHCTPMILSTKEETPSHRLGTYYLETGYGIRPSKVIYDRAGSAIAAASAKEFDWDKIFSGADWFHWTGITPALGGEMPQACMDACKAAREKGLTISCDLNYRKKLWTREQAGECMAKLLPYVDVCIANEEDAKDVFGIEAENTDINSGKLDREGYISVARQIASRFGCKKVAITLRGSISASDNDWAGMLYDAASDKAVFSTTYHVRIVDRVGGGDSFGGGLIYALLAGKDDQQAIDFAVAASCLKHSVEHDFNQMSVAEVEALAAGNASGRVQR